MLFWVAAFGCAESQPELTLATPDPATFQEFAYPVLLRDCGFPACHGSHERFFQVFGPGRGRLDAATRPIDPPTMAELLFTYERSVSMIDPHDPDQSLLLRKPLSAAVHGAGHEGVDSLGRNVYEHEIDAGYVVLRAWVRGELVATTPVPTTMMMGTTP